MSKKETEIPSGYKRAGSTESAGSAFAQLAIGAAIVGGLLFWYYGYAKEKEEIHNLIVEAREKLVGDDVYALMAANEGFQKAADRMGEDVDDKIVGSLAEINAILFQSYGMSDLAETAKKYVELAKERDLRTEDRYSAEAYVLLGEGHPERAERVVTALTDKGIRRPKLLHALSVAKLQQGKAKEAQRAAEEGTKITTSLVRLPVAHGDSLLAQGMYFSAMMSYDKALRMNEGHQRAAISKLLVEAISRKKEARYLHKMVDTFLGNLGENPPKRLHALAEYTHGEVYLIEGKIEDALKKAVLAIQIDPNLHDAFSLQARALGRKGDIDKAQKVFQDLLARMPTSVPYAKAGFEVLHRAGKTKEGVVLLEKVEQANKENALIYPALSIAQAKAGKAKEALKSAEIAVEKLGNAHPEAIFAKARALQANRKFKDAEKAYAEAISYNKAGPIWPEVFYEMGWMRFEEKAFGNAADLFKQSIEQWEKARAPIDTIVDAYLARAKALQNTRNRKNAKEAKALIEKAKSLQAGS
jgi:tetratricopeptide (TPR) repeat protein